MLALLARTGYIFPIFLKYLPVFIKSYRARDTVQLVEGMPCRSPPNQFHSKDVLLILRIKEPGNKAACDGPWPLTQSVPGLILLPNPLPPANTRQPPPALPQVQAL